MIQTPHSDESASSRNAPKLARAEAQRGFSKAVEAACACQRVVPGTIAHTKEVTGLTYLNEVVGGWSKTFTRPFPMGEWRSNFVDLGDRVQRLEGGANLLEQR